MPADPRRHRRSDEAILGHAACGEGYAYAFLSHAANAIGFWRVRVVFCDAGGEVVEERIENRPRGKPISLKLHRTGQADLFVIEAPIQQLAKRPRARKQRR